MHDDDDATAACRASRYCASCGQPLVHVVSAYAAHRQRVEGQQSRSYARVLELLREHQTLTTKDLKHHLDTNNLEPELLKLRRTGRIAVAPSRDGDGRFKRWRLGPYPWIKAEDEE